MPCQHADTRPGPECFVASSTVRLCAGATLPGSTATLVLSSRARGATFLIFVRRPCMPESSANSICQQDDRCIDCGDRCETGFRARRAARPEINATDPCEALSAPTARTVGRQCTDGFVDGLKTSGWVRKSTGRSKKSQAQDDKKESGGER